MSSNGLKLIQQAGVVCHLRLLQQWMLYERATLKMVD